MKKVLTISLKRLRTEEDFGFHRLVISEIPKLTGEGGSEGGGEDQYPEVQAETRALAPVLQTRIDTYKTAYEQFDDVLKEESHVPAATLVSQADDLRDEASRKVRNYAKTMTEHPNPATAALAQQVVDILDKYGDPTTQPQNEESGTLHNIMQDITALGTEKLQTIHIEEWTGHLQETMDAYDAAVAQRAKEESGREVGIIKQTRQETDEAYRSLVRAVNSLAEIEGDTDYAAFIDAMNSHIEHQKETLKMRETNNAKKDDPKTEEPEPEEPDTEAPSTEEPGTETPGGEEVPDDRPVVQ